MVRSVCLLRLNYFKILYLILSFSSFSCLALSSSISKTSEDTILVNSPTLDMGLLVSDNHDITNHHQSSPITRSISHVAPPVDTFDRSWEQLFGLAYDVHSSNDDFSYWTTKSLDEVLHQCQSGHGLEDFVNDYFDEYLPWINNKFHTIFLAIELCSFFFLVFNFIAAGWWNFFASSLYSKGLELYLGFFLSLICYFPRCASVLSCPMYVFRNSEEKTSLSPSMYACTIDQWMGILIFLLLLLWNCVILSVSIKLF